MKRYLVTLIIDGEEVKVKLKGSSEEDIQKLLKEYNYDEIVKIEEFQLHIVKPSYYGTGVRRINKIKYATSATLNDSWL